MNDRTIVPSRQLGWGEVGLGRWGGAEGTFSGNSTATGSAAESMVARVYYDALVRDEWRQKNTEWAEAGGADVEVARDVGGILVGWFSAGEVGWW